MRCKQAQSRINAARFGYSAAELDKDVREHLESCAKCRELAGLGSAIGKDLERVSADMQQETLSFAHLQQGSRTRSRQQVTAGEADGFTWWFRRPAVVRYAVPAMIVIVAGLAALFSPLFQEQQEYDIVVAGVDEALLSSGAIPKLLAAVGVSDAQVEDVECDPQCVFRVKGIRTLLEAQLAAATLESVPNAIVYPVDSYEDTQTGVTVTRTTRTTKMDISDSRWSMELGADSTIYQRVSIVLDSLKQDTTIAWIALFDHGDNESAGVQEEYTVHPDGSYSNSIVADPRAGTGWTKQTWTYDSAGAFQTYTITDTQGIVHDIDMWNWTVQEKQLEQVGIYYMITYSDEGTPYHTCTNVDANRLPGYGPHLAPGMFLHQNDPNPFDTLTSITFGLPETSHATLKIYNSNSQLVRTLVDSTFGPGEHTIAWDCRDDDCERSWSYMYLCKLEVGEYYHTIVMSQVWQHLLQKADTGGEE